MASLADGIALKTWHLMLQELDETEQSPLNEQSFLPVQGAITSNSTVEQAREGE